MCTIAGESGRVVGITAAHDAQRARVTTSPAIPCLDGSASLARSARTYATTLATTVCPRGPLTHSAEAMAGRYGENIALVPSTYTASEVVAAWAAERACYDYRTNSCDTGCAMRLPVPSASCGHYTQVVWRDTTAVGCGVATCGDSRYSIWVCHYAPPGNVRGRLPY